MSEHEDGDWVFSEVGRTYSPPRHGLGWHSDGGCTIHMQMTWVPKGTTYCFWLGKDGLKPGHSEPQMRAH